MKRWNVYKKNSRYRACKNMNSNRNFNWNHDRKTADSVSQRFSKFLAFYQWLNSLSFLENDAWVCAYVCSISKSSRQNCIFNKYMAWVQNYKITKASIFLPPAKNWPYHLHDKCHKCTKLLIFHLGKGSKKKF